MARGFESKSVEQQRQDAESRASEPRKKVLTPEEMAIQKQREDLLLSRQRVERELRETPSERRRESLRAALDYLDEELRKLSDAENEYLSRRD